MRAALRTMVIAGALVVGGVAFGQNVADAYRRAADAYREAAAKAPADQRECYDEWAEYYDCLVDQLRSGSSTSCTPPSCKLGSAD